MGKRAQARLRKVGKKKLKALAESTASSMSLWDKLKSVKVKKKDKCLAAFVKAVKEAEKGKYKFEEGSKDMGDYYIVNETGRHGSNFVHIVPTDAYAVFEEMMRAMPDSFLGFSMLCGKVRKKDLRVSCFAIPTAEITKALISRK